jgi:hypothetical protein
MQAGTLRPVTQHFQGELVAETMTRQLLLDHVVTVLKVQPFVHALWLEGADAAGTADAYSDLDLWADVDAGYEAQAFACIRAALLTLGPLDVEHDASHPHPQLEQRFYRVAGTSPFWFVDVCLQRHGRETVFAPSEPFELLFDRSGVVQTGEGVIERAFVMQAVKALEGARWRRVLVSKEVERGRRLEALAYYHKEVLEPLTRLLRLRFSPAKHDYGLKHIYADLPGEVTAELEALYAVVTLADLPAAVEQADRLFRDTLAALTVQA